MSPAPYGEKEEQTMNDMPTGIIRDSKEVETPVSIRVATPLDGEGLRGMFSRSSSETIHRRFHTPFPQVPEWMLALMLERGPDRQGIPRRRR